MTDPGKRRGWHPLLTVVIVLFLTLTAWAIEQARQKVSPVSDPDYYSNGLHYSAAERQAQAAEKAGWSLAVKRDGDILEVRVTDQQGRPVSGADAELVLVGSHPGNMKRVDQVMTERDPGQYLARLPAGLSGQVLVRFNLTRDEASLHRSMLLNF